MVESRESVTWTFEQVFWLQFPRNKYASEIAYHTMKVTQLWWMFQKEARILSLCHCQVFLFKRSFLLILYFPGGGGQEDYCSPLYVPECTNQEKTHIFLRNVNVKKM
jgi:hypothetical protein